VDAPAFAPAPAGCAPLYFSHVQVADVMKDIQALPDKQCVLDPLPTWRLKKCAAVLTPFLCHLFGWSLEHGIISSTSKSAYTTPILKKMDLDPADVRSYWSISNLSVISKQLKRTVGKQLVKYLRDNNLLPNLQSAFIRRTVSYLKLSQINYWDWTRATCRYDTSSSVGCF
jgi:hypothetical protein